MARSAAIIVQKNQVALVKRVRGGKTYYVFPGGGVEEGETPEDAVVREIKEELGLDISVERLIVEIAYRSHKQFYFLVKVNGGEFGSGTGPEMIGEYPHESGTYEAAWLPISSIPNNIVYPAPVAELVVRSVKEGWASGVIHIQEEV